MRTKLTVDEAVARAGNILAAKNHTYNPPCAACGEPYGRHGGSSHGCPRWKPSEGGEGVFTPRLCGRASCGHIEAAHADGDVPFSSVCMVNECDCHEFSPCLGTPPVDGCGCGVALAASDQLIKAGALAAIGTPGSTIRAMAASLRELASLLSWRTDETWCRELADNLEGFARQLPTRDGGDDAAREVRHA